MTYEEYKELGSYLLNLSPLIPLKWRVVPNDRIDQGTDIFNIHTYDELNDKIKGLTELEKNYFRRRWFIWQCSLCDEFLFSTNENVCKNPNPYDKSYDVSIAGSFYFDIKGTVIPSEFRNSIEYVIDNPQSIVDFYYEHQSKEKRFAIQNRLFIVHHSFVNPNREMSLRCSWSAKENVYSEFCQQISSIRLFPYQSVKAGVIFILEREDGKIDHYFPIKN